MKIQKKYSKAKLKSFGLGHLSDQELSDLLEKADEIIARAYGKEKK